MSGIRLKTDLQQAIANNILNFNTTYNNLIFEGDFRHYFKSFYFIESMNVSVEDNKMNFNIELNQEKVAEIPEEDMERIRQCDIMTRTQDYLCQKLLKENNIEINNIGDIHEVKEIFELQEEELQEEENNKQYRKATYIEKAKMKTIQKSLLKKYNLKTELVERETFLSLEINTDELKINKKMIMELFEIFNEVDIMAILPYYENEDIDDDTINGVRLFIAIDLSC